MTSFGISIPQAHLAGAFEAEAVGGFARRAEDLGYDSLWVGDGLATAGTMEAWTLLSYGAAVTSSVRLGTSVLVLPWRNPVLTARAAATLDQLSGGRVILGVGIGDGGPGDAAFGVDGDRRAVFEEQISLIRRCWDRDAATVSWNGAAWSFEGIAIEPKPRQRSGVPIWFGGEAPAAIERTARLGDGWMGRGSSTTEDFRGSLAALRRHLHDLGRAEPAFPLSKRLFAHVVLDGGVEQARRTIAERSLNVYGDAGLMPRCGVVGDPDACAAALAQLVELDLDLVLLDPIFDHARQARLLKDHVLSAFG